MQYAPRVSTVTTDADWNFSNLDTNCSWFLRSMFQQRMIANYWQGILANITSLHSHQSIPTMNRTDGFGVSNALSFYRSQNVLCWSKFFVPDQRHIVAVTNILRQTKRWFAFSKIDFCAITKVFEEALNTVKFLGWLKKFGLAQNILGPVKGQGIRTANAIFWNYLGGTA